LADSFFQKLLSVFFPKRCPLCHGVMEMNGGVCPSCEKTLSFIDYEQIVNNCRFEYLSFEKNLSVFYYRESVRNYICDFKFQGQIAKGKALSKYLADAVREHYKDIAFDMVVPVPVHPLALKERSYNHAEVIAREVAFAVSVPLKTDLLVKLKQTQAQHGLRARERKENLYGAFSVSRPQEISGRIILLVDDIVTTGSTLHHCAEALLKNGAAQVYTATLALTNLLS